MGSCPTGTLVPDAVCLGAGTCATFTPTPTATPTPTPTVTPTATNTGAPTATRTPVPWCPECGPPPSNEHCMAAGGCCTPNGHLTSNLGLCKPNKGESGWLDALNCNADQIAALHLCMLPIERGGLGTVLTPDEGDLITGGTQANFELFSKPNSPNDILTIPYLQPMSDFQWTGGVPIEFCWPSVTCDTLECNPGKLAFSIEDNTLRICVAGTWKHLALQQ